MKRTIPPLPAPPSVPQGNKKKVIKKAKPVKAKMPLITIMAPAPKKYRQFDVRGMSDAMRQANVFVQLQGSEGWLLLKQTLESLVSECDKQIISKFDHINLKKLEDKEVDDLRAKRGIYQYVIDLPNSVVQSTVKADMAEEDDDPYYTKETMTESMRHK